MNPIRFHRSIELLIQWERELALYTPDAANPPLCLRCGQPLASSLCKNALSRALDVYVCSQCGVDEALRQSAGKFLPLSQWHAIKAGRLPTSQSESIILSDVCCFPHIFSGPKKSVPLSTVLHPESELAYSRSDYDGRQWWRNWFPCTKKKSPPVLAKEIDTFTNQLMALPEFRTIWDMQQACRTYAEPTADPAEYNLYAETDHFYIWLRLITRETDYNLYCHFYVKNAS